ncbi:unnamed protein product [Lymnaea stagnalis]|uniref:tRNA (guanine(26)-N(2))-dimethyltransferase n=1 Tax=Lymnaea stagnalis TaxID=6523 RepID=A0AAV2I7M4_LYMST
MDLKGDSIKELGVNIHNDFTDSKPKIKAKRFNRKLKLFREFTLATLSALTEIKQTQLRCDTGTDNVISQVSALDALACTGVAGIQWKKHLSSRVHVTLADRDDVTKLTSNSEANDFSCSEFHLNPLRVPGDLHESQSEKEVHVCNAEAKAVMVMEAFNFIYLNPQKNATTYFEPAFNSLTCRGLLCFVFPDVSLFARSAHVVQRYYGVDVVKTEYLKELTARIIIGSLARAAARSNKGIMVQYVISFEDYLLICVKVCRGHAAADTSLTELAKLQHCRLCEQRNFIPQQLALLEDPYSLLACKCKEKNPGKTAVSLGPMWKGPIYDWDFLNLLHKHGKQISLSSKFFEVIHLLLGECMCAQIDQPTGAAPEDKNAKETGEKLRNGTELPATTQALNEPALQGGDSPSADQRQSNDQSLNSEPSLEKATQPAIPQSEKPMDITETEASGNPSEECSESALNTLKRKLEHLESEKPNEAKRHHKALTDNQREPKSANVPFYYNVSKFKRTNIPKLDKLVTILRCAGYKASRTHFDHSAIRTTASVDEFLTILG